jgi:transposase-like protein
MVVPDREKLIGNIEVDETFVGGKKVGKRGRGAEGKTLVLVALEVPKYGTGRVRFGIAPDASGKSLKAFICENIEPGSLVTTDGWKGYWNVSKWGYEHKVEQAILKENEEMLPHLHRIAALLKRWLLGTHQNYVSSEKLAYYLDEYTFRHNRRTSKSRGLLFRQLVEQAVNHTPITHREIIDT